MDNHMLGNLILLLSLPAGWLVGMAIITAIERFIKKFLNNYWQPNQRGL